MMINEIFTPFRHKEGSFTPRFPETAWMNGPSTFERLSWFLSPVLFPSSSFGERGIGANFGKGSSLCWLKYLEYIWFFCHLCKTNKNMNTVAISQFSWKKCLQERVCRPTESTVQIIPITHSTNTRPRTLHQSLAWEQFLWNLTHQKSSCLSSLPQNAKELLLLWSNVVWVRKVY